MGADAWPRRDDAWQLARLRPPVPGLGRQGAAGDVRPRVVIDTDAANEIDDQFALAWALLSRDALRLEAIHAAPFSFAHRHALTPQLSTSLPPFNPPDVGMRRSLAEVERVLATCGARDVPALAGTPGYLPDEGAPPRSAAVDDLIERALGGGDEPLYVLAMGCPTNVAAALLLEPAVAEHIVVVWTSGYPSSARLPNHSFNFEQDPRAARVLIDSGVPLVYLPGYHVGAQLRLSLPEMERWVAGHGPIGALLHDLFTHNPLWPLQGVNDFFAHSWVMWDMICVAWMLNPDWVPSQVVRTAQLGSDLRWLPVADGDTSRPWMREAHAVRRDAIFRDFFEKLAGAAM